MEWRFTKQGKDFEVKLVDFPQKSSDGGPYAEITYDGVSVRTRPIHDTKHGWVYQTYSYEPGAKEMAKRLFGKVPPNSFLIKDLSAEDVAKEIDRQRKTAKQARIDEIVSGRKLITLSYHDGEYLSGYQVFGDAAELLEKLSLAHYVSGWGYHVEDTAIDALGTEFTYAQAEELARPAIEAKQARALKAKQEREAKFAEAKATGKPVVLSRWVEECNDPNEDCNVDCVVEYAMPDGSTKVERCHTW